MLTYFQLDAYEEMSEIFQTQYTNFHSRKYIWKCLQMVAICLGFSVLTGIVNIWPSSPADIYVKDLGQKSVQQITHYPWLTTLCSIGLATSDVEHMARLYLTTRETNQA